MSWFSQGEITEYHVMNEEESPQLPLSEEEQQILTDVEGGETCAFSIAPKGHKNRGVIRRLLRRGYLGSCSVSGCAARHYFIWHERTREEAAEQVDLGDWCMDSGVRKSLKAITKAAKAPKAEADINVELSNMFGAVFGTRK